MKLLLLLAQASAFSSLLATFQAWAGFAHASPHARNRGFDFLFFSIASVAASSLGQQPGPQPFLDAVCPVLAGVFGGPTLGLAVGFVAAGHRLIASGPGSLVAGGAVALHGLLAGLMPSPSLSHPGRSAALRAGLAALGGAVLLACILLTAGAVPETATWIRQVWVPTLVVNPPVAAIFMLVLLRTDTERPAEAGVPERSVRGTDGEAPSAAGGAAEASGARAEAPGAPADPPRSAGEEPTFLEDVPGALAEVDLSGAHARLVAMGAPVLRGARARRVPRLSPDYLRAEPDDILSAVSAIRFRAANEAALELLGARSPSEVGGFVRDRLDPSGPVPGVTFLRELSSTGRCRIEVPMRTLAGERRWIELRAHVARGAEDDWRRVLVSLTDLTEARNAEERKRSLDKLEAIGTLAGGVAHDFNNILAAILGYAEVLLVDLAEADPTGQSYQDAAEIKQAALRAKGLVQQLLSFSQRRVVERRRVELLPLVRRAVEAIRAKLPPGIDLELALDPAAGDVQGDPAQLEQVVLNLCANAEQAMGGAEGRLLVSLDRVPALPAGEQVGAGQSSGDRVRITVADTGHGMDAATLQRAYEPFFTTRKGESSGLGLSVVHGVVSTHGGNVEAESSPGMGATFRVYLPRLPDDVQQIAPNEPARRARVLVVDDEGQVALSTARMLESLGHEVTALTSSQAALDQFRLAPRAFDLVLTDAQIPGLSGEELTRQLLAIRPDLPVLICTGFSDLDARSAAAAGARGLLAKPLERSSLDEKVREALRPPPFGPADDVADRFERTPP